MQGYCSTFVEVPFAPVNESKMKLFLILLLSLLSIFALAQIFMATSTAKTEQHKYKVLKKYDSFEIREYEPALFSRVSMKDSTYKETASNGFRILAGYIFGNNESNQKIAMTSPVVMEFDSNSTMKFMVPTGMQEKDLPKPSNSAISFEKQEKKTMAVIVFGGWANDENIEKYKLKLSASLKKEGIEHSNKFIYMGYNPPYEIINRRNEVAVELTNYTASLPEAIRN